MVLESVADARVVAPEHRWALDLADEPVTVTGDELRLHQVLTNLLSNARRHTPAGTTVTVGTHLSEESSSAVVTVHDDGPGIAPDAQESVFERFTRGDSARTRASGGVGLGLSLARAITEAHGGRIGVRSRPGSTCFTVSLPR
jgi:two-component system OmpR family sensor kinase